MTFSYNRLWKRLIDKGMTKTEMRMQAGISTNILAKICSALECGLNDIVEIKENLKEV